MKDPAVKGQAPEEEGYDHMNRLGSSFFQQDVLKVAPRLLGKVLVRRLEDGLHYYTITDVEAYRNEEDKACHASRGRTARTEMLYAEGGKLYVYLVYGRHWMLNVVTGKKKEPQAVLIRGIEGFPGPGKVTQALQIDRSFHSEDISRSKRLWIMDQGLNPHVKTGPRIHIDYAGEPWLSKPWRFYVEPKKP